MPDPRLTLLDRDGLQDWILRRLGAPQLLVELDQGQLDICFDEAMRWFAAKKGVVRTGTLQLQAGVSMYKLPEEVGHVTGMAVVEPTPNLNLAFSPGYFLPEQQIPYNALGFPTSGGILSAYLQSSQYIDTGRRVLGLDPDFEYDPSSRMLRVSPIPRAASAAQYTYKSRAFTLDQLAEIDHDLVKRRALAIAKEILGRIRSKRDAHPGAQGSVRLDGEVLLKEAAEEKEALDAEVISSGGPLPFLTG